MAIKMFRQDVSDDTARFYMAMLLWVLVLEIVSGLLFVDLPQANREVLIGIGGTIVGGLLQSANYYNKTGIAADRQKDETIHTLSTTAASIQSASHPEPTVTLKPGDTATVEAVGRPNDARD